MRLDSSDGRSLFRRWRYSSGSGRVLPRSGPRRIEAQASKVEYLGLSWTPRSGWVRTSVRLVRASVRYTWDQPSRRSQMPGRDRPRFQPA